MPSRAELHYAGLLAQPDLYAHLSGLVGADPPAFETEYLDFKIGAGPGLDEKVKRQKWSEALSGFGNTEGGVLVWGLHAKKDDQTQVDRVTTLALCPDVSKLEQLLRQSLHDACDPPIAGVQIETVPGPDGKAGFVICLVPEGTLKPHRAELDGKRFYLRIGDSFKIPSVSILRSMFYSKEKPYLVPLLTPQIEDQGCRFLIEVRNQGSATASDIFVTLDWSSTVTFTRKVTRDMENTTFYSSSMAIPIHPSVHPGMFAACAELSLADRKTFNLADFDGNPLKFQCKIFCRDAQPLEWQITMDQSAIQAQKRLAFELP